MSWNCEKPDWPNFTYNSAALESLEKRFLLRSGEFIGAFRHIGADDQDTIRIELIGDEAVKTSEKPEDMLRFDLENERETIANYRQRIRQAEALGEYALSETLRGIILQEQEHLIDLADALGIDVPR